MRTNKKKLQKGVKFMAITLLLMFAGPVVIHSSFKNREHALYYPVLFIGVLLCITAIVLGFKGIRTIIKALFGED